MISQHVVSPSFDDSFFTFFTCPKFSTAKLRHEFQFKPSILLCLCSAKQGISIMDSIPFKNSEKMCKNSEKMSRKCPRFVLLVALAVSGDQRFETKFSICPRTGRSDQELCLLLPLLSGVQRLKQT